MISTKNSKSCVRKTQGRRRRARFVRGRRLAHNNARLCKSRRSNKNVVVKGGRVLGIGKCSNYSSKLSHKLEALKNLINPSGDGDGEKVKAEKLFQDTADYIVLLRTQVVILQRLIEFYNGSDSSNVVVVS